MIGYLLLLIVVSFCQSEIYYVEKIDYETFDLKFTKLLGDRVENKVDSGNTDRSKVFQADDSDIGKNEVESVYDKNTNHCVDYSEGCKSLVGINKTPVCKFLENSKTRKDLPTSCKEIKANGNNKSGIYEIQPRTSNTSFTVLCDMQTKEGGWTHIQKRFDGSVDFYRGWREYKHGFGDLNGEFWIGLENIYHITGSEENELLIELTDRDQKKAYAQYETFEIGAEKEGYPLSILTGYKGDAGDSLTYHLKMKFTTYDVNQHTSNRTKNCAVSYLGAWWYGHCHLSNLNGKYMNLALSSEYKYKGLAWDHFKGSDYNLAGSRMLVRSTCSFEEE